MIQRQEEHARRICYMFDALMTVGGLIMLNRVITALFWKEWAWAVASPFLWVLSALPMWGVENYLISDPARLVALCPGYKNAIRWVGDTTEQLLDSVDTKTKLIVVMVAFFSIVAGLFFYRQSATQFGWLCVGNFVITTLVTLRAVIIIMCDVMRSFDTALKEYTARLRMTEDAMAYQSNEGK